MPDLVAVTAREKISRPYAFCKGENSLQTNNMMSSVMQDNNKPRILLLGKKKLAIFQSVIINSAEATVMFDTGALGNKGNWISANTAERLNAYLEPTKRKSYVSPLFPEQKFVSKTKTSLSILFSSFGFEIEHVEFRVMEASTMKAEIILGLEFIEQYDIMSYLTEPTKYNAVHAPQPAKEEDLDSRECSYKRLEISFHFM
jgi:hypothetical protein